MVVGLSPPATPVLRPAAMASKGRRLADAAFGASGARAGSWFGIIVVKIAEVRRITPQIGLDGSARDGIRPESPLPADLPSQDALGGAIHRVATHLPPLAPIIAIRLRDRMR